jgi:hypothetical protein
MQDDLRKKTHNFDALDLSRRLFVFIRTSMRPERRRPHHQGALQSPACAASMLAAHSEPSHFGGISTISITDRINRNHTLSSLNRAD